MFSALIFNVISSALRSLTSALGSAVAKTDGFGTALARLKGAAATAAAPLVNALGSALTYVMNLAAKAFAYLAKLISLLTGKSLSGMQATAKKMTSVGTAASGMAKQTDKAAKSLAGFDEIERLDEKDNSSSGGSGSGADATFGALSEVGDVSGITGAIDSIKAAWQRFTNALARPQRRGAQRGNKSKPPQRQRCRSWRRRSPTCGKTGWLRCWTILSLILYPDL